MPSNLEQQSEFDEIKKKLLEKGRLFTQKECEKLNPLPKISDPLPTNSIEAIDQPINKELGSPVEKDRESPRKVAPGKIFYEEDSNTKQRKAVIYTPKGRHLGDSLGRMKDYYGINKNIVSSNLQESSGTAVYDA